MSLEVESVKSHNISLLRARDPSIQACGLLANNLKTKEPVLESTAISASDATPTPDDDHLQVYLRMKRSDNYETLYEISDNTTLRCKIPEGAQCVRNVRDGTTVTKLFKFSSIFGPDSQQTDLFNDIVKRKVLCFINGFNCSLLTYGASGSGKTYTIVGTANAPGIVPRALEYLFRTLPQLPSEPSIRPTASGVAWLSDVQRMAAKAARENLLRGCPFNIEHHTRTYKTMQQQLINEPVAVITDNIDDVSLSIWVSFTEIYNEQVHDLLTPEPPRGQPRKKLRLGEANNSIYIKDLTTITVTSGLQAYHVLQYGLHNLKYAATSVNDHSSRSHSIFTITLAQASDTKEGVSVSVFNFCDLAGSERMKKTNNVGDRLKESNNINTSLLVLGRCISLVRDVQKRSGNQLIPFRESKLTQIFRRALLGQEAISMVVNINPTREMFDESQHVLNFSAIAKEVAVQQQQVVKRAPNKFTEYLERRTMACSTVAEEPENVHLKEELETQLEYLVEEIEQNKLAHHEDREHIITTYKRLLADTEKYWTDRCEAIQDKIAESINPMQTRSPESEPEPRPAKKRKLSVIVLDSSSEDEDAERVEVKPLPCKTENPPQNPTMLQTELSELQSQCEAKVEELRKLKEETKAMEEILHDAKSDYLQLQTEYESTTGELSKGILEKQDQIDFLSACHEDLQKQTESETDDDAGCSESTD